MAYGPDCNPLLSGQWWHGGAGEPGWHPEAPAALPQRGSSSAVPVLPGERPAPPRTAGPAALVPERKGLSNIIIIINNNKKIVLYSTVQAT